MVEHDHPKDPIPAPGTPQDHAVAALKVHPRPASRRIIGITLVVFGLVVVLNTVGNFIGVKIANDHTDNIVRNNQIKGHQRDLERDAFEKQLKTANTRIDTLVNQVHNQQVGDDKAICSLLVGSIELSRTQPQPGANAQGLLLVKPLLTQLHCMVPPGLFG